MLVPSAAKSVASETLASSARDAGTLWASRRIPSTRGAASLGRGTVVPAQLPRSAQPCVTRGRTPVAAMPAEEEALAPAGTLRGAILWIILFMPAIMHSPATWRKAQRLHFIRAYSAMSVSSRLCPPLMSKPDFNLLITLDVLLAAGSVAGAAQRLRLSPSAMSRALARLRETIGDPLLVRAGRGLVPTPRALELRDCVSQLVQEVESALRPAEAPDLTQLVRAFTLRTSEGFAENFGPALIARLRKEAPGARLRFVQKADKDSTPLREGTIGARSSMQML